MIVGKAPRLQKTHLSRPFQGLGGKRSAEALLARASSERAPTVRLIDLLQRCLRKPCVKTMPDQLVADAQRSLPARDMHADKLARVTLVVEITTRLQSLEHAGHHRGAKAASLQPRCQLGAAMITPREPGGGAAQGPVEGILSGPVTGIRRLVVTLPGSRLLRIGEGASASTRRTQPRRSFPQHVSAVAEAWRAASLRCQRPRRDGSAGTAAYCPFPDRCARHCSCTRRRPSR